MCRLALLWIAAHALSPEDRSYLLSLVLTAIVRISTAEAASQAPAATAAARSETVEASKFEVQLRTAQHAALTALTAAAEQLLSCVGGQPASWALHSIHCLLQVSGQTPARCLNLRMIQIPAVNDMHVAAWCRGRTRAQQSIRSPGPRAGLDFAPLNAPMRLTVRRQVRQPS